MKKIVCITGATSGIGKACAYTFASHGYDCILLGRRAERLKDIAHDLQEKYSIQLYTGIVDVRDYIQVNGFFQDLPQERKAINVLINNAGLAKGFATIKDVEIEDIDTMIDTNLKGLLYVSKYTIPLLSQQGHIFNIGSISAKSPYSGGATYCATKAGVNLISDCMRLELLPEGKFVTCINPGLVDTEFQFIRADNDKLVVDEFLSRRLGSGKQLNPSDIAELIYDTLGKNIPEITYRHTLAV